MGEGVGERVGEDSKVPCRVHLTPELPRACISKHGALT